MTRPVEVWLRGPIPGIAQVLQPAAHALLQVAEDVLPIVASLTVEQLWERPGGAASIGFHLKHLPGSLDRLLTYSRGESLSKDQLAYLTSEGVVDDERPSLESLTTTLAQSIEAAIAYLRTVPDESVLVPREVGRQKLPSSTLGLIFHAAEHSSRHAGQIVTLYRVVSR
jgi:uncharacterized damage-inducible protein DinB